MAAKDGCTKGRKTLKSSDRPSTMTFARRGAMMDEPEALIGEIYDCALDRGDWAGTLSRFADFCGAENAALVVWDPRLRMSQVVTPRADPGIVEEYGSYWWQHDLTAQTTARMAPGVITDLCDTGRDRFFASTFYNEYWKRSGLGAERLASNLFTDGTAFGSIVLQASQRRDEIGAEARDRFGRLLPHVVRAVRAARRMRYLELAATAGVDREGDGLVLVDGHARILLADAGAEALLAQTRVLRTEGDRLVAANAAGGEILARAVRDAIASGPAPTPGSALSLRASDGEETLSIKVFGLVPSVASDGIAAGLGALPAAALVLSRGMHARERAVGMLQSRFGLTRAEARLALEMTAGDGRKAAAARCGISLNTARTHLGRIFEKAGVRRQAELVRRMAEMGIR
jgi:DNA-binding CsgD family transcriptional regulator